MHDWLIIRTEELNKQLSPNNLYNKKLLQN